MPRAVIVIALLAFGLGGCTWVALSSAGQEVRVRAAGEVAQCEKLGATRAKTSDRAWVFARNPRKIDQELENLARNEAAAMGGDSIVPDGPIEESGRRRYHVYRCAPSDGALGRERHHSAAPPTSATPARL